MQMRRIIFLQKTIRRISWQPDKIKATRIPNVVLETYGDEQIPILSTRFIPDR